MGGGCRRAGKKRRLKGIEKVAMKVDRMWWGSRTGYRWELLSAPEKVVLL